jgi:SnoaL-like protein
VTDARATVTALSHALVEAWDRADWPAYRALAAPAYRYEEASTGRRISDIDAVLADWRQLRAVFPDIDAEIVDVLAHGGTSVVGLVWRATQSAPVHTPAGPESPSYKRIRIADSVTLTWDGDRLTTERHQLGILSVLAATQELACTTAARGHDRAR